MLLYTWKDVERYLLLNRKRWGTTILDIETYTDELVINLRKEEDKSFAEKILEELLGKKYDGIEKKIFLDLQGEYLTVGFDVQEDTKKSAVMIPLFKNVLYQQSAYYSELLDKELPGVPVLAFHSYKGGVGRTLSLLAFVKAWSVLKDLKSPKRLLIVDADIEAPGITWLKIGRAHV